MTQAETPEYLTIRQACELLRVHATKLGQKGVLKAHRIGVRGIRRYKRADLIKFMKQK